MDSDMTGDAGQGDDAEAQKRALHYEFKPSLLGALWLFDLEPDALVWRAGRRSVTLPYRDIVRVRLTYRPQSLQAQRYRADILGRGGRRVALVSATWRGMLAVAPQAKSYTAFLRALHARIAQSGGSCEFVTGLSRVAYVAGVGLLAIVGAALFVMMIRALTQGYPMGAAFVAAFMLLGGWQLGRLFWRNRPRRYDPNAIPDELLPPG